MKSVSNTNIIAAISALTPGLNLVERSDLGSNPNRVPELLLRGMSSFSSGTRVVNQPTIMLDGVEISMEELYDLDMNEIENITVLKDASATALYGSRAANGVIVIERKKLAEGNIRVNYNLTGNVQFPYLKDYDLLNARENWNMKNFPDFIPQNRTVGAVWIWIKNNIVSISYTTNDTKK